MAQLGSKFAVLAWNYGSCSGCDRFEDMSDEARHDAFVELIQVFGNEADAMDAFGNSKGW